jgi:4-amino-4-deoxy-L-arabinose transferase-like glycosyltransferase
LRGTDSGTVGKLGTREKDITLDIAKRLKERLKRQGYSHVVLTREEDVTVALNKRVELAHSSRADIFISIHLNYLPFKPINIIETYYFGPTSDAKTLKLAEQENAGSDYGLSDFKEMIEKIGETVKFQESRELAGSIQKHLFANSRRQNRNVRDFGVKRAPFVVLLGVVLLSVISHRWIARHFATVPPPWDQSLYLYMAFKYWNSLMEGGLPALVHSWLHLIVDRGTLFPLSTLASFLVFGPTLQAAYATNAIYLGVMLVAVYKTARWLGGGWRVGLLAAFICATTPAVINYSRDYLLDFPMAALITAALYTLLRSDLFRERRYCLGFGVWVGLALLAKPMAAAYLAPLALYPALVASALPERRRGLLGSLGLAGVGFALVAAPWYSANVGHALANLVSAGFGGGSVAYRDGGEGILTWNNVSYYPRFVLAYGLGFPYTILGLGLASRAGITTWRRGPRIGPQVWVSLARPTAIIVIWLLTMYVVLTVTPNKNFERYTVALLPALAVLAASWIHALPSVAWRTVVTIVALLMGLFNYWALTFGIAALPRDVQWHGMTVLSQEHYLNRWFPYHERWPLDDALAALASQVPAVRGTRATIYVLPNHGMVNALSLMARAEGKRYPFSFTSHDEKVFDRDRIKSFEFVITKTGADQGPGFANVGYEEARQAFAEVKPSFTLLQQLRLPDGSYLELFKRRSPALAMNPRPQHPTRIVYGGAIELLGYDFERIPENVDRYAITYYWKCVGPIGADYSVFVHLARTDDARVVAWQDHRLLEGAYPASRWRPGEIFSEQYHLRLEKGVYQLRIGLYRPAMRTGDPRSVLPVTASAPAIPIEGGSAALVGVVDANPVAAVEKTSGR